MSVAVERREIDLGLGVEGGGKEWWSGVGKKGGRGGGGGVS